MEVDANATISQILSLAAKRQSDVQRGRFFLTLSPLAVVAVNRRLDEIKRQSSSVFKGNGQSSLVSPSLEADVTPAEHFAISRGSPYVVEHMTNISLYDVCTHMAGLVIQGQHDQGVLAEICFAPFKHLRMLELRSLNVALFSGTFWLRERCEHLVLNDAVPTADHLLLADVPSSLTEVIRSATTQDFFAWHRFLIDAGGTSALDGIQAPIDAEPVIQAFCVLIREWSFRRLSTLSLARNGLTVVDGSLFLLPRLRHLDLSQNNISSFGALACCPDLETLALSFNAVRSLDGLADACPKLKVLSLRYNKLQTLDGIGGFKQLKLLDVRDNLITTPVSLRSLADVKETLTELKLAGNPIASCPQYRGYVLAIVESPERLNTGIYQKIRRTFRRTVTILIDDKEATTQDRRLAQEYYQSMILPQKTPPVVTQTEAPATTQQAATSRPVPPPSIEAKANVQVAPSSLLEAASIVSSDRSRFLRTVACGVDWDAPVRNTALLEVGSLDAATRQQLIQETNYPMVTPRYPTDRAQSVAMSIDKIIGGVSTHGGQDEPAPSFARSSTDEHGGEVLDWLDQQAHALTQQFDSAVFDIDDGVGAQIEVPTSENWLQDLVKWAEQTTPINLPLEEDQGASMLGTGEFPVIAGLDQDDSIIANELVRPAAESLHTADMVKGDEFDTLLENLTANAEAADRYYEQLDRSEGEMQASQQGPEAGEDNEEALTRAAALAGVHTTAEEDRKVLAQLSQLNVMSDFSLATTTRLMAINAAKRLTERNDRLRALASNVEVLIIQQQAIEARLAALEGSSAFAMFAHDRICSLRSPETHVFRVLVPIAGGMYSEGEESDSTIAQNLQPRILIVNLTAMLLCEYSPTLLPPRVNDALNRSLSPQPFYDSPNSCRAAAVRAFDLSQLISVLTPHSQFVDTRAYRVMVPVFAESQEVIDRLREVHTQLGERAQRRINDLLRAREQEALVNIDDSDSDTAVTESGIDLAGASGWGSEVESAASAVVPTEAPQPTSPRCDIPPPPDLSSLGQRLAERQAIDCVTRALLLAGLSLQDSEVVSQLAVHIPGITDRIDGASTFLPAQALGAADADADLFEQQTLNMFSASPDAPINRRDANYLSKTNDVGLRAAAIAHVPAPGSSSVPHYRSIVYLGAAAAVEFGESLASDVMHVITTALRKQIGLSVQVRDPAWAFCLACGSTYRIPGGSQVYCAQCGLYKKYSLGVLQQDSWPGSVPTANSVVRHPLLPKDAQDAWGAALIGTASVDDHVPRPVLASAVTAAQLPAPSLWRLRAALRNDNMTPASVVTAARALQSANSIDQTQRYSSAFDPAVHTQMLCANVTNLGVAVAHHYQILIESRVICPKTRGGRSRFSAAAISAEDLETETVVGVWCAPFNRYALRDRLPKRLLLAATSKRFFVIQASSDKLSVLYERPMTTLECISNGLFQQQVVLDFSGHRPFYIETSSPTQSIEISELCYQAASITRTAQGLNPPSRMDLTQTLTSELLQASGHSQSSSDRLTSYHVLIDESKSRQVALAVLANELYLFSLVTNIYPPPSTSGKYKLPSTGQTTVFKYLHHYVGNKATLEVSRTAPSFTLSCSQDQSSWRLSCLDIEHRSRVLADIDKLVIMKDPHSTQTAIL